MRLVVEGQRYGKNIFATETFLTGHPDLDPAQFSRWLAQRRSQVDQGKLIYIAHKLDFLVRV